MEIKTIQDIKDGFIAKKSKQIISFNVSNKKHKEVIFTILYWYPTKWYRVLMNNSDIFKDYDTKKEALKYIIKESKKLWLKDSHINNLKIEDNNDFDVDNLQPSSINLKTVADLKRLPVWTFLRRIYTPRKTWLWVLTRIKSIQSNAFNLEYDETWKTSLLDFPAATECKLEWNKITYYFPGTKEINLVYEVYEDEWLSLNSMNLKYWKEKVFANLDFNEIQSISRTEWLVGVFLKNDKIAFIDTMDEFCLLGYTKWGLIKVDISKLCWEDRYRSWIAYSKWNSFSIVLNRESYKVFKKIELVYNEETWYNLIKGDWKLYEVIEDIHNKPDWRNYWLEIFWEFKWKWKITKGKTQEEIEMEIKQNNIKRDIEKKLSVTIESKGYIHLTEESAIKYLESKWLFIANQSFEDDADEREHYLTTDNEKTWTYIKARVRKYNKDEYRAKQYTQIRLMKRKHIDLNAQEETDITALYNEIIQELDLLEATWKENDPVKILEKLLDRELRYGRKKATITFKNGTIEKRRLFKWSHWFWYLPKWAQIKWYKLILDDIKKIEF